MTSIKGAIGNNMKNDPEDVKTIKEALHETGHMVREDLENGYITQALDKAVKGFQRIHDLKIDGILKPNGETAQALALAQQRKKAILEGSNADFTVTPNPQASSDQPWYALKSYSEVTPNEKTIDALSKAAKVDPDLVKSIIYVEA